MECVKVGSWEGMEISAVMARWPIKKKVSEVSNCEVVVEEDCQ